jgi:hypothetical protein
LQFGCARKIQFSNQPTLNDLHPTDFSVPTRFWVMSDLPRTPTAKVQKAGLRGEGQAGCITRANIKAGSVARGRMRA